MTLEELQKEWREKNPHNDTYQMTFWKDGEVKVGNMTYGLLYVFRWGTEGEGLEIGHYCSIAESVAFVLGGNHIQNRVSTFPFAQVIHKEFTPPLTKGKIIVGDDVWIGMGATILSGVTIGQGAIIGAGSVVSKEVFPYSIVVGNPATEANSNRFHWTVIEQLTKLDYSKLTPERMAKHRLLLETEITSAEQAKEIVDELMRGL